jgi:hypothetical protein
VINHKPNDDFKSHIILGGRQERHLASLVRYKYSIEHYSFDKQPYQHGRIPPNPIPQPIVSYFAYLIHGVPFMLFM